MTIDKGTEVSGREVIENKGFRFLYTVDSFANGIAFGQHRLDKGMDPRDFCELHLGENKEVVHLRSRYALHPINPLAELESHLMRLSKQGMLRDSTIFLGVTSDPFYPFEGKFDASMKFLQLFERYTPGLLTIQTRSPLLVIAMPVLRKLGKRVSVTIGIETCDEASAERYTPGLPRVSERLKTAMALRRFGIEVTLQVSPLLPYGDWKSDAAKFAAVLNEHADYIYIRPLIENPGKGMKATRAPLAAERLAEDRKFHFLRQDAANPLIGALEILAPKKLTIPVRSHLTGRQMQMFAA